MDVRVDVKIPGGVNAYVIDLRGERYIVTSFPCSPILQPEFYADTKEVQAHESEEDMDEEETDDAESGSESE